MTVKITYIMYVKYKGGKVRWLYLKARNHQQKVKYQKI